MNDNPPSAGSPPESSSPDLNEESPTLNAAAPEVELQPPEDPAPGTGQNLPGPRRQGWVTKVLGGRARRDQQLQTLQSGYVEMLDMMRSISGHLDRQAQAQDQLMKTLDHFPDAVEGLRNVGKATEQQVEVMGMVRNQLETNSHHEREIVKSMDGFNKTLNLMDETSRNTTAAIGDLVDNSRDSEDELRAMLERSEKRLTVLTGVLGTIGLLAIAGAIYFGITQRGSSPDTQPPVTTVPTDPAPTVPTEPIANPSDGASESEGQPSETTPVGGEPVWEETLEVGDPAGGDVESPVLAAEQSRETMMMEETAEDAEAALEELEEMTDEGDAGAAEDVMEEAGVDAETTTEAGEEAAEDLEQATEDAMEEAGVDAEVTAEVSEEIAEDLEQATEDAIIEEAGEDASVEPVGAKNVVRRFFSFLGDEDVVEEGAGEDAANQEEAP